jgi:citrate lyase subunit beta/citryl-CoA lyase
MLAKARELRVGELVIDLEDAVVPDRKPEALAMTVAALAAGFAAPRVAVRVNPVGSPWLSDELRALSGAGTPPDSVVVPKVSGADDLVTAAGGLTVGIGMQALIETADGVAQLGPIIAASPRLEALILGYADLAVSLGRTPAGAANLDLWLAIQDAVLVAARAGGIKAIDGPFLTIADEPGLTASATRAAELGFDGKWAIHPAQIDPITAAFTPTAEQVARAREVVDALAHAEADGAGAVAVNGLMIDEPVRLAALRTLELAGER